MMRKSTPVSSLRLRLFLLVLLGVLPALGVMFYTGLEQRRLASGRVQAEALLLTRLYSDALDRFMVEARQLLVTLAQVEQVRRGKAQQCSDLFVTVRAKYPVYANIAIADQSGQVFASAVPFESPLSISEMAWFRQASRKGTFAVGGYQIDAIIDKPAINFAYPVVDEKGVPRGTVFATLDLNWMSTIAARANLPEGATLTIIDRRGRILSRWPDPKAWLGKQVPLDSIRAALARRVNTAEIKDRDSVSCLVAFTPFAGSAENAGFVSISIPRSAAFADANRTFMRGLSALALVILLALTSAWLGGHLFILRRVNALLAATQRLSAGDLSARTGIGPGGGELERLGYAFDEMAASLQTRRAESERAESALRESNDTLHALIQASPIAIIALDRELKVRMWNPSAQTVFGWFEEDVSDRVLPILADDANEGLRHLREQLLHGEPCADVELPIVRRDGKTVEISFSSAPLRAPNGELEGAIVLAADVTARKRLEQQFRQSQKMEAVGSLAGGVAHDFNNLLTAILGFNQLIMQRLDPRSGSKPDDVRRHAEEVRKAATRASMLTRQLLAFSRRQVAQPEVLNLNALVIDMEQMLRRLIGEHITLETRTDADLGSVKADPGQIEQIVLNLVVNARDAMPEGGTITIETTNVQVEALDSGPHFGVRPGDYVMLSVIDTGCGMSAETLAHIFEPFFTTKAMGKGTGLGLSTVYGIVQQAGGDIRVVSEVGQGTTLRIYLPRVDGVAAERDKPSATLRLPRGSETLLLVEDEEAVRSVAVETLRLSGYTVLEAENGEDALRICKRYRSAIDLMVTDVIMPRMGGPELVQKAREVRPDLEVLYVSGYAENAIAHHGVLVDETIHFLQKPFSLEALSRKVRELLDARDSKAA